MSLANGVGQSFKKNLDDQVKQLTCLQSGDSSSIYLQEYHLQSIYHLLLYEFNNFPNKLNLNSTDLSKIVKICTKVVETPKSVRPNHADIWRRCELWALKILILVVKQPSLKHINQKTLKAIHNSLIKLVRLPEQVADEQKALVHASVTTCLSACCLSQIEFDRVLSPDEANQLITEKLLPLAVYFLSKESRFEGFFLDILMDDFHGVKGCRDEVFTSEYPLTYPQLVQLLLGVMRRSECGPRGYRKRFEIMLNLACARDHLIDEDIVALNLLAAHHLSAPADEVKHLGKISMDLLAKSEGPHRAHIAFLLYQCFVTLQTPAHEKKDLFIKLMLDDMLTRSEDLLFGVATNTIWNMREHVSDWGSIIEGKELAIIQKLIDRNIGPDACDMFLRKMSRDDLKGSDFDTITMKPITLIINDVWSFLQSNKYDSIVIDQLKSSLKCLKSYLKLRHRRLGQDLEMRLNQAIELIVKDEHFRRGLPPDGGELIARTNMQQVYPSAWKSTLDVLRYVETIPYTPGYLRFLVNPNEMDVQACRDFVQVALPHLLMVDTEKFYRELGSLEVIETIYRYCKQVDDSVLTPIKEILLTWPKDSKKTRLDSKDHRRILNKFIELLIEEFDSAEKNRSPPRDHPDGRFEFQMSELLFGLVAAFSFHREALYDVLYELEKKQKLMDRNAWLRDKISRWAKLMVDYGKKTSFHGYRYWGPALMLDSTIPNFMDSFSSVIVAYDGIQALMSDSQAYSELEDSSDLVIAAIRKGLKRGFARTTVGSVESKRYMQIEASLPIE